MMDGSSMVGAIVGALEHRELQRQINERATLALFSDPVAVKEARRKAASDRMKAMWAKQRAEEEMRCLKKEFDRNQILIERGQQELLTRFGL